MDIQTNKFINKGLAFQNVLLQRETLVMLYSIQCAAIQFTFDLFLHMKEAWQYPNCVYITYIHIACFGFDLYHFGGRKKV